MNVGKKEESLKHTTKNRRRGFLIRRVLIEKEAIHVGRERGSLNKNHWNSDVRLRRVYNCVWSEKALRTGVRTRVSSDWRRHNPSDNLQPQMAPSRVQWYNSTPINLERRYLFVLIYRWQYRLMSRCRKSTIFFVLKRCYSIIINIIFKIIIMPIEIIGKYFIFV